MKGFRPLLFGGVVGKAVGIGRELLLAYAFGTSGPAAAYRVAQSATLLPVNFFTSDALSAGFLPNYSRLLAENPARATAFYQFVSRLTLAMSVFVAVFLAVGNKWWVAMLAPGLSQSYTSMAAAMLFIMALGVPAYITTAMGSYLEMAHGHFKLASTRASIQSIGLICGTILAIATGQPTFLAWGFTLAYFILAFWTRVRVRSLNLDYDNAKLAGYGSQEALGRFWRSMRGILLVPFAATATLAVERMTASLISDDAVAALDYARLVTETALILVAAPLGIAVLASQSSMDPRQSRAQLLKIVRGSLVAFIPASVVLVTCGEALIRVAFQHGNFDATSTQVTSLILFGLGTGLWAQVAAFVMMKSLSAQDRNWAASTAVAVGAMVSISFNISLHGVLGPITLGLASSISALAQFIVAASLNGFLGNVTRALVLYLPGIVASIGISWLFQTWHVQTLSAIVPLAVACGLPSALPVALFSPLRQDARNLRSGLARR